jgi:hypothetical protein
MPKYQVDVYRQFLVTETSGTTVNTETEDKAVDAASAAMKLGLLDPWKTVKSEPQGEVEFHVCNEAGEILTVYPRG